MESNVDMGASWIAIVSALVAVVGAVISLLKFKPEKKKTEADAGAAIGNAAESIAEGARVTVEMLNKLKGELEETLNRKTQELEETLQQEREAYDIELGHLKNELKEERNARKKAEKKMDALQKWINALLEQLKEADIAPAPFEFQEDLNV